METTVQQTERWLACRVDDGMFSDELAVTYPASSEAQWQESVFVPASFVHRGAGTVGKVRVKLVRRGNTLFAILPDSYGQTVAVQNSDVFEEP